MREVSSCRGSFLAESCVFIMIPLLFIYQSAVQAMLFQPFLKGYSTVAMLFSFPLLLLMFFKNFRLVDFLRRGAFNVFILFMVLFLLLAVFSWLSGVELEVARYIQLSSFRFVFLFLFALALVLIGRRFSKFIYSFFIIFSIYVIISSEGGFVLPPVFYGDYIYEFDYQQVSFCFLVISMVLLPSLTLLKRYIFYIFIIPALYLIGARSEFFAFLILLAVIEVVRNPREFIVISIISMLSLVPFLVVMDLSILAQSRIFSVFFDGADLSADARAQFAFNAYDQIEQSPLIGAFASHPPGEYAHNVFSAWVDFGVFGFLVYLVMLLGPLLIMLFSFSSAYQKPEWLRAFCFLGISVFLLLFAKAYTYGLAPMAVAMYCVFRNGSSVGFLKLKSGW